MKSQIKTWWTVRISCSSRYDLLPISSSGMPQRCRDFLSLWRSENGLETDNTAQTCVKEYSFDRTNGLKKGGTSIAQCVRAVSKMCAPKQLYVEAHTRRSRKKNEAKVIYYIYIYTYVLYIHYILIAKFLVQTSCF